MSLDEAGLTLDLVVQLCLKTLFFAGELTGTDLTHRLGLVFSVIEPALEALKSQRHCEITGGGMLGGSAYRYRITDAGRVRASLFLEQNHYVGRAPVPLEQYRQYMERFGQRRRVGVTREAVRRAFSHLVLPQRVLDQLGPAINAGHSLFVYGPPGNGKTVISQAIRNLLLGEIAIPHALEVEGSIIRLFDPVTHQELPAVEGPLSLETSTDFDERWVRCRRPLVLVGGELTLDQLDVRYSQTLGFYRAPIQTVANGGVLVIDDFGRQLLRPEELLNRWMVPMDRQVDHLVFQTGETLTIPFDLLLVFATNLQPSQLGDEAFFRRIRHKIRISDPDEASFRSILRDVAEQHGLTYDDSTVDHLIRGHYEPHGRPFRGVHPRDIVAMIHDMAKYRNEEPAFTPEWIDRACRSYFIDD
jgi:predicted ATPase with chaperone activity